MKRLLVTRRMPARVLARARAHFDVTHRDAAGPMTPAETRAALAEHDALMPTLGDPLDAANLDTAAPLRCRMLANFGVGYNHIDVAAARRHGITVSNTPGAVTDATADIGVMLALMACRRASEGEALARSGKWTGWEPTQLLGLHMSGKVLGVIGMGRIGTAIARRCHFGFGMRVILYNRSPREDPGFAATQLPAAHDVAAAADVVVIALPGGPGTRHMIDAGFLGAMQRHAVLVNIARGDIVDETALIGALRDGWIAGAGLDVYEGEPAIPPALIALPQVTLLPHLGTAALEVREAMGMMALDNLVAWSEGRPPPNAL